MNSRLFRVLVALFCTSFLLASGCGEKAEKVDLAAQVTKLTGDTEAKIDGLAEIAKLGAGAAGAVDKIIPLLKDEDAVVRRTAAYALGAIGPAAKAAVPQLKALLQTTDRDQLTSTANALRAIVPAEYEGLKVENVAN